MVCPGWPAAPAHGKSRPLDLRSAEDNIYAYAKTWGTLGDEPVFGGHEGVFFAVAGNRRAIPLFGYVGFGSLQFRILPNGDAEYRGKDATFYTDLKTGELLDTWQNPFTGKTVKVYPYINEQVTTTIPARYPAERMVTDAYRWEIAIGNAASRKEDASSYRGDRGESGKTVPFVLPWRRVGNHYLLSWDWMLEVTNPVTPEGWPESSTGPVINPSEHFVFFVPADELEDRGRPWATMTAGFFRQCPWLPWMRMGRSGVDGPDVCQLPQLQDYRWPGQHPAGGSGTAGAGPAGHAGSAQGLVPAPGRIVLGVLREGGAEGKMTNTGPVTFRSARLPHPPNTLIISRFTGLCRCTVN